MFLQAVALPAAITVTHIGQGACAGQSLFVKSDGSLWGMGNNEFGQLGDGTFGGYNYIISPEEIVASNVVAAAVGSEYSLFLKSDGSLWAMGENEQGVLGIGTNWRALKPVKVVSRGVIAVAAGSDHSLFLKSDGSLWGMGDNTFGELGIGTNWWAYKPVKIVSRGVTAIAAGGQHSLFLKYDGSLWGMGDNGFGQLGDGTFNSKNKPEEIITADGRFVAVERSYSRYGYFSRPRSRVTAIAAGGAHSLFLTSDGSLWAMGNNSSCQLGFDTNWCATTPVKVVSHSVTAIAAGGSHSLFLKSDGSLWAMGSSANGQVGDGSFGIVRTPQEIVARGVEAIAAGADHSLFVKSGGILWGMGYDLAGALGDGFWFDGISGVLWPEQIWPRPQPVLAATVSSSTNLQFAATCGFGGTFCLLAGTDLSQPYSQWTPVSTNIIRYRFANVFSATLTNAVNSGNQQFYILQSP
jgi:alpha-tubulin suppressor-like RCC1 family protein